jgi:phosphoribosylformimino-5-aminoimidazole carboxamide ribotide isomerase
MTVELIPVIDLLHGLVVRAVGGRRHEYRPIQSMLVNSAAPLAVARALLERFQPTRLYVADLDAIGGAAPAWAIYRQLRSFGVPLWIDAGVRSVADAVALADAGVDGVVCGLETVPGPVALKLIVNALGSQRVVFSLDLKEGQLLCIEAWQSNTPVAVAEQVIDLGVRRLIVLDVARVGEGSGTGTEELCRWITTTRPDVALYAGGGIRSLADLERLKSCGVRGALVASALHDGAITPAPTLPLMPRENDTK